MSEYNDVNEYRLAMLEKSYEELRRDLKEIVRATNEEFKGTCSVKDITNIRDDMNDLITVVEKIKEVTIKDEVVKKFFSYGVPTLISLIIGGLATWYN